MNVLYVNMNMIMTSCQMKSELKWKQSGLELNIIVFNFPSSQYWHNILVIFYYVLQQMMVRWYWWYIDRWVYVSESSGDGSGDGHRREPLSGRSPTDHPTQTTSARSGKPVSNCKTEPGITMTTWPIGSEGKPQNVVGYGTGERVLKHRKE